MSSEAGSIRTRVVYQVASVCLGYPDADLFDRLPLLRAVLADLPGRAERREAAGDSERTRVTQRSWETRGSAGPIAALTRFVAYAQATAPELLARQYVALFDFDRKHALHLSYWSDGDTRRRGAALAAFKQRYRDSGALVNTHGELPDHLSMVLEFAALVDPDAGRDLLLAYRAGLELLRLALIESETPYADLLVAVCATLPGPSPRDKAAARALAASGPPVETVGLEPYGSLTPRLLPLTPITAPAEVR